MCSECFFFTASEKSSKSTRRLKKEAEKLVPEPSFSNATAVAALYTSNAVRCALFFPLSTKIIFHCTSVFGIEPKQETWMSFMDKMPYDIQEKEEIQKGKPKSIA